MTKTLSLLLCTLGLAALACAADSPAFPIQASPNGRYLVDQKGRPFLYQADTAWMLFLKRTEQEAVEYMADRKAKGFTVIQTILTGFRGTANLAGEKPFAGNEDFAQPNEKYFAHVDRVVAQARKQGLLIAIAPLWAGCCREGWAGRQKDGTPQPMNVNGPAKLRAFGRWLGKRYRPFPNVMWILGGDNDPHETTEEYRQLGLGLMDSAPEQLRTYHAASTHSSTDVFGREPWLNLSMVYTYFRGFNKAWNKNQPDVYEVAYAERAKTPVLPFILGESTYEGEHGAWGSALQARKQAYWVLLAGGAGHAYGSPNWNFPANWREVMQLPGAASMRHLSALFHARPWYRLTPDEKHELAVSGSGPFASNDYATTAYADDRSFALTYMPSQRTVSYNLAFFPKGRVRAWWFDPRTGTSRAAGEFPAEGSRQFASPDSGDWVLVLDSAGRGLPALP